MSNNQIIGALKKVKNLTIFLSEYKKNREKRKAEIIRLKRFEIRGALIKFYSEKQSKGEVDLPPFILADDIMKTFIQTDKDVEFYYKQLRKYKICEEIK